MNVNFIKKYSYVTLNRFDSLKIVRLTILSHFDPCTMLPSGNIILSDDASPEKKNDTCPLCPLYVYYDDSGQSVDVR